MKIDNGGLIRSTATSVDATMVASDALIVNVKPSVTAVPRVMTSVSLKCVV